MLGGDEKQPPVRSALLIGKKIESKADKKPDEKKPDEKKPDEVKPNAEKTSDPKSDADKSKDTNKPPQH